jgi:hypothetical protein
MNYSLFLMIIAAFFFPRNIRKKLIINIFSVFFVVGILSVERAVTPINEAYYGKKLELKLAKEKDKCDDDDCNPGDDE